MTLIERPLLWAVAALFLTVALGVAGYMWIEGWGPFDALWMVAITLTTIGFGEVHPLSHTGRVFTLGLIIAGVSIGTYAMTQLTALVVEGRLGRALRERQRRRRLQAVNDHYIVIGYGRLGTAVVEELVASGVKVCVIEKDAEAIPRLEASNLPFVVGDGSDDDVLREAGVTRARGLAVAVSHPAEAVFATMSARELNPNLNIVTRVADPENAVKARRAGATAVVSPHTMGGWRMAHGLVRPHTSSFLDLASLAAHADIQLDEFVVEPASPLVGGTLGSLQVGERHGVLVVAIRRADGTLIPTPHATALIQALDVLIVIGAPKGVRSFGEMVTARPRDPR